MKIAHKVPLASSFIIIASFAIFSWFQSNMIRNSIYENLSNNIAETSIVLSQQITNWLNSKLALIDMMSETIDSDFSMQTIQETMDTPILQREFLKMFGALDIDGVGITSTIGDRYLGENWDGRARPWYPLARANNKAVLTPAYADSATNEILISAVANYTDNGVFKGAYGGDLSLNVVSEAVNTINFNNSGYAFLIDSNGDIISHPNLDLNGENIDQMYDGPLPLLKTNLQEAYVNGEEVYTAFHKLENLSGSEWFIGVALEKDKVLADAVALNRNAIIAAILTALISTLIVYLIMKKLLIEPITNLTVAADQISRGKLVGNEIKGVERNDEVGALARSIDRMSKGLKLAITRLQKNRNK